MFGSVEANQMNFKTRQLLGSKNSDLPSRNHISKMSVFKVLKLLVWVNFRNLFLKLKQLGHHFLAWYLKTFACIRATVSMLGNLT